MPYSGVGTENSGAIELHHEDRGTGTPVVLIHGYPLSGRAWDRQVPALLAAGHRVVTYDRRGFGLPVGLFDGFVQAAAADTPAWMKGFLDNFYNIDQFGGTLVSDQAFQSSWNIAAAASATAAVACIATWQTDFRDDLPKIDVPVLEENPKCPSLTARLTRPRLIILAVKT